MTFAIGQKVIFSAQRGKILALEADKRGRTFATVALETGRTVKLNTRSIEDAATAIDHGFNPGWSKSGTGR